MAHGDSRYWKAHAQYLERHAGAYGWARSRGYTVERARRYADREWWNHEPVQLHQGRGVHTAPDSQLRLPL